MTGQFSSRTVGLLALIATALPATGAAQTCNTGNLLSDPQFAPGTVLGNYTNNSTLDMWLQENAVIQSGAVGCVVPQTPGTPGMLHLSTAGSSLSQVRQVVNVAPFPSQGLTTVVARATFNSPVAGAIAGIGISDGVTLTPIPGGSASLALDANCNTWEEIIVCVQIPANTQRLNFDLRFTNGTIPQGGFVDEAWMELSVVANDSCWCPTPVGNQASFAFDTTCATTDGQPAAACNFSGEAGIENDVWFQWTAPANGDFLLSTCGGATWDTKIALYLDESQFGGSLCPTQEPLCCNDDACSLQSEMCCPGLIAGTSYLIRVGNYPGANPPGGPGTLTFSLCGTPSEPGTKFCIGDGSGTQCPIGNNNNSSLRNGAAGCANSGCAGGCNLTATGTPSCSADDLVFHARGAPNGTFGIFFSGTTILGGGLGIPFGEGLLCTGGNICRIQVVQSLGVACDTLAQTSVPICAACNTFPGQARHYQYWYRDVGFGPAGFNTSNAYTVTTTP